MFCGNCGKQIPEGSGFCPSCGTAAGAGGPQTAATASAAGANATPSAAAVQRAKIEAQLKAGSQDAVQAFMVLVKDPVGGLAKSYSLFDQNRALVVGGIFAVVFALAMMISAINGSGIIFAGILGGGSIGGYAPTVPHYTAEQREAMRQAQEALKNLTGGKDVPEELKPPSEFSIRFKAAMRGLAYALVFAVVLAGACVLARIIFKGTSQLAGEVYMAGASLLPMAVAVLLGFLLFALDMYGIVSYIAIFALAWMILMLNSGCQKIMGISDSKAAIAVPTILVIAAAAMGLIIRGMA